MEKSLIQWIGAGAIFLFLSLLFTLKAHGKHYDEVRIPNNGIVSYYDFEGSHTGDPTIPDKVGKNDMKVFGFPRIVDGTAGEGWYSNLVEVVGTDGFSFLEIPYIHKYNTKSFSIGFYGGFGTLFDGTIGLWDLHKNYYWSWGDKIAMCITAETVVEEEHWVEGIMINGVMVEQEMVDEVEYELYTTNLRFGDKTYSFYTHDAQFAYHQYVVVYDGTNRILMGYWDGQQHIRELNVPRPKVSGSPIRFATDHDLEHNFSGRFDEIAFYNRPLTPIEVTRYYGGMSLKIEPKEKLTWIWGEVKTK